MNLLRQALALLLLTIALASPSWAVNPDEVLDNPVLEARARTLSKELRCMVCQNQSIDDSNAELARDLRVLVRDRLVAGDSDEAVLDYVVSRYGEFVLLKPRFTLQTLMLWGGPALILLIGGIAMLVLSRGRSRAASATGAAGLSEAEQVELAKLLTDRDQQA
ncbi:cytochrome c-type biogenesis protein CcmH [Hoeflea sp. G2-23]|uniref:Cytochrome c-type biogenesis protein n=1 Tax=Hoeflea algicola TaxID=2983763 RepID=A0ABT3Z3K5_9HYPH|nr:cytochrome c-type biogenesis protein [Hoeflea algicola]MCY0146353.1 cytochrome c-type biogenesis protein CcmH [Hoeflea algicola]